MTDAQLASYEQSPVDASRPVLTLSTSLPPSAHDARPDVTQPAAVPPSRRKTEKLVLPDIVPSSREWMAEIGRRGGLVSSPAKALAARLNGMKGGRPRKSDATAPSRPTLEIVTITAGNSLPTTAPQTASQPAAHQGIADFLPRK